MPNDMLRGFHWTFLIRHPRKSIPSYFRCTIPPLDEVTGFHQFMPNEAGYDELRRLFDHLLNQGIIGPARAGETTPVDEALNGGESTGPSCSITVIDADDLLVSPEAILKVYCNEVGIDYKPSMLEWSDDGNQQHAQKAFEKWYGFHHDAIESTCLKPRAGHHVSLPARSLAVVCATSIAHSPHRQLLPSRRRTSSGARSTARRLPRSSGTPLTPTFLTMST